MPAVSRGEAESAVSGRARATSTESGPVAAFPAATNVQRFPASLSILERNSLNNIDRARRALSRAVKRVATSTFLCEKIGFFAFAEKRRGARHFAFHQRVRRLLPRLSFSMHETRATNIYGARSSFFTLGTRYRRADRGALKCVKSTPAVDPLR